MILQNESSTLKKLHAIRRDNYEHTKNMTPEERSRLRAESAMPLAEEYGFRIVPKAQPVCTEQRKA